MILTLLTVVSTGIVLTAVYVLLTQNRPAEVLAGETTMANAAAAAETLSLDRPTVSTEHRTNWQLTTVSCLCDAEELLDVLENQGYEERELVVLRNSTFAVRWR